MRIHISQYRTLSAGALAMAMIASVALTAEGCHRDEEPTPEALGLEQWHKLILHYPDSVTLWNKELRRLDEHRQHLASSGNPTVDVETALAVSSNDQLRGIALRHLERYAEAMEALMSSRDLLSGTWNRLSCTQPQPGSQCSDVAEFRSSTMMLMASVYWEKQDVTHAKEAFKEGVALSRGTPHYRVRLEDAMRELYRHETFAAASALVLGEIANALEARSSERLATSVKTANALWRQLFFAICWTVSSGELRDGDPRDFVDNEGIGVGKSMKYGMTSPEEDQATFFTESYRETAGLPLNGQISITEYVRDQMAKGNFEPVAKYLSPPPFFADSAGSVICPTHRPKITFGEIHKFMREAPAGTISATTADILTAFAQATSFVNDYCPSMKNSR